MTSVAPFLIFFLGAAMVAVLMISSLLNIAYLMPIPIKGFFGKSPNHTEGGNPGPVAI